MNLDNILQSYRTPYILRKNIGLERINKLLDLLDNPQDKYKSIHIAGTNGKGSVSAMIHSVLVDTGHKIAIFTSPHIEIFTERIKVNYKQILEADFLRILHNIVIPKIDLLDKEKLGKPTEFEIINTVAFYYFAEQKVDYAIFEAGLGGRLDSTNTLNNVLLSIITSISYDHMDRLGKTLEEITIEKAGIIKPKIPLITISENIHTNILEKKADEIFFSDHKNIIIKKNVFDFEKIKSGYQVICNDPKSIFYRKEFYIPLFGIYQLENFSIVLKAIEVIIQKKLISFKNKDYYQLIKNGIDKTKWSGRFDLDKYKGLQIIMDGAHNPEGMKSFCKTISEVKANKSVISIFACNKDKNYKTMLNDLSEISDFIILTKSHVEIKSISTEDLTNYLEKSYIKNKVITDYKKTLEYLDKYITENKLNKSDTLIIFCGSLYLIGAIKNYLKELKVLENE